jgi:hypothetical protein
VLIPFKLLIMHGFAQSNLSKTRLTNRNVLAVGDTTYTVFDAYGVLLVYKSITKNLKKIQSDFLSDEVFPILSKDLQSSSVEAKMLEKTLLLFLCLSYQESLKLKLFQPDEKTIQELKQKIIDERREIVSKGLATEWQTKVEQFLLEDKFVLRYLNVVLRGLAFEKSRGGLSKNPVLLSQAWHWSKNQSNIESAE